MRRLAFLASLLACLLAAPAWGRPIYVGTITSSGASTTNLSTATPFNLAPKQLAYLQCDAAAYVYISSADGTPTAVTSSNGVRIEQYALVPFDLTLQDSMQASWAAVAVIPVTGSSLNCKVFTSAP